MSGPADSRSTGRSQYTERRELAAMIIDPTLLQSPFVETTYQRELQFLAQYDRGPRPPGWLLTPRSVVSFILGSAGALLRLPQADTDEDDLVPEEVPRELVLAEKLVGEREQVERCVRTLAGARALLLVGAPGTGKSLLAELLAAAISKTSALTVQGTLGTTEAQLTYSWNEVALLSRGPSRETLVPSAVVIAMRRGGVVRIEEISRCRPEVQEALVTILSERRLAVAELDGHWEQAHVGFNVIATAPPDEALLASATLRRRFTVETIEPIAEPARERALVRRQGEAALARAGEPLALDEATLDLLVTVFRDLRSGSTREGWSVDRPSAPMSTADAIDAATSLGLHAAFFAGQDAIAGLPAILLALVLREAPQDRAKLLAYWDGPVKRRAARTRGSWAKLHDLRSAIESR
jgi:MoxR-like ATPase